MKLKGYQFWWQRWFVCVHHAGKLNVKDEELDEMLNEGKGPINFTVFLSLFGEKLNGENMSTDDQAYIWLVFNKIFQNC